MFYAIAPIYSERRSLKLEDRLAEFLLGSDRTVMKIWKRDRPFSRRSPNYPADFSRQVFKALLLGGSRESKLLSG